MGRYIASPSNHNDDVKLVHGSYHESDDETERVDLLEINGIKSTGIGLTCCSSSSRAVHTRTRTRTHGVYVLFARRGMPARVRRGRVTGARRHWSPSGLAPFRPPSRNNAFTRARFTRTRRQRRDGAQTHRRGRRVT